MGEIQLHLGDCLDVMAEMDADSIDTIITDPPYGLEFMGKDWDSFPLRDRGERLTGSGNPTIARGFGGNVAYGKSQKANRKYEEFSLEWAAAALRVAKPGAMLLAFGGTRTHHRLMCAIEDAGWEIRDCLMWLYGSGFPKSHDISKAIDKANGEPGRLLKFTQWFRTAGVTCRQATQAMITAGHISDNGTMAGHYFANSSAGQPAIPTRAIWGTLRPLCNDVPTWVDELVDRIEAEREVVAERTMIQGGGSSLCIREGERREVEANITAPATDAAATWDGWGTALKPAYEPILLCRKPLTIVPFDGILSEVQNLIGGALCLLLSNANNAERISRLSPSVSGEVSVSALMLAAVLHGAESGDLCEKMDMSSSPEAVSTCLSIARLWSSILGDALKHGSTYTTSTATVLTTALETLSCLLSASIPAEVIRAVSLPVGCRPNVNDAESSSASGGMSMNEQSATFVAALASLQAFDNGTPARNAASSLQLIIPSVASVLNHVLQQLITESGERLRPNWEPIILAMKPRDGTFANNALTWGVAGLNVDGGRIPTDGDDDGTHRARRTGATDNVGNFGFHREDAAMHNAPGSKGRWPANLILDEAAGEMLGEQSGEGGSNARMRRGQYGGGVFAGGLKQDATEHNDTGTAARFFYCAKAPQRQKWFYCAICDDAYPVSLVDEHAHGKPPNGRKHIVRHPTQKPLELMRYLVKLTRTPTGGNVLDMFMGTGSTGEACILEGRPFVGVDRERPSYVTAKRRLAAAKIEPEQMEMWNDD